MLSFNREEPAFCWEGTTSVLQEWCWSEERKSPFQNRVNRRPRWIVYSEEKKNRSYWPFNWDWNGLFTHDFPLLQLPHTVLLEAMKLLDNESRRELSWSCRLLRRLIVKNQTPAMDRRRKVGSLNVFLFKDFNIITEDRRVKNFDSLSSFLDFVKTYRKSFFIEKVRISYDESRDLLVDFSQVVRAFEGTKTEARTMSTVTPSLMLIGKMFDAFLKYPHLMHVELSSLGRMPPNWNEYCATVAKWAESKGMSLGTERYRDYAFRKEDYEGRKIIVICTPTCADPSLL